MRRFKKGRPPDCVTDWLKTTPVEGRRYAAFPLAPAARAALEREQGWLCAYCMGRIGEGGSPSRLEHYVSQRDDRRGSLLQLEWRNWLAVCSGGREVPDHCDRSKGAAPLLLRPSPDLVAATDAPDAGRLLSRYDAENLLKYRSDGTVYIDAAVAGAKGFEPREMASLSREIDVVLNLNVRALMDSRRMMLDATISALTKRHGRRGQVRPWREAEITAEIDRLSKPTSKGKLRPYHMIAVRYLERKRAKLSRDAR